MLILLLTLIISFDLHLNTAATVAKEGTFTFEVAINYQGEHICSGAIISEYLIVTTAHSIKHKLARDLTVTTADLTHEVNRTEIHPFFATATRDYDVALITLIKPMPLDTVITVSNIEVIPNNYIINGAKEGTLVYWETYPLQRLMYSHAELWAQDSCTRIISNDFAKNIDLLKYNEAKFCAAIEMGSCEGDDGGSLIVDDQLLGIVSSSVSCDMNFKLLVFTNLAYVREWVVDGY
ncbi:hypodermin-A-like [Calliphora vicina]|uniref:hypodermin-A-like n=1 Tax=Calliphora vicina TaxID=7373 RepID=UPI00325AA2B5